MYFDVIETKFNRPERNWVENEDVNIGKISVFQSHFRSIGRMSVIAMDNNLRNKAEHYVLQNCPEIQQYLDEHRNEIAPYCAPETLDDVQSREFPKWFKNKSHAVTDQLLSLASGSNVAVKSYPGCVFNGVKFLTHKRDITRSTQNSGIAVKGPSDLTFYGILEEIYDIPYTQENSVILFKCKWFDTNPSKRRVLTYKNRISINVKDTWYENEPFILASQAEQVFYVDDLHNGKDWKVVEHFRHRHIWDPSTTDHGEDVIIEDTVVGNFQLSVDMPPLESSTWAQPNVHASVVTDDVQSFRSDDHHVQDDFINDEEIETYEVGETNQDAGCVGENEVDWNAEFDDDIDEIELVNADSENEF